MPFREGWERGPVISNQEPVISDQWSAAVKYSVVSSCRHHRGAAQKESLSIIDSASARFLRGRSSILPLPQDHVAAVQRFADPMLGFPLLRIRSRKLAYKMSFIPSLAPGFRDLGSN